MKPLQFDGAYDAPGIYRVNARFPASVGWIIAICCLLVTTGCLQVASVVGKATRETTGTKVAMDASSIAKIKTLGIQVKVNSDFTVRLARETSDEVFQNPSNFHDDAAEEKKLRLTIQEFDLQGFAQDKLVNCLRTIPRFESVFALTDGSKSQSNAGVLIVQFGQWGLQAGPTEKGRPSQVHVGLNVTASLAPNNGGKLTWERTEFITGGSLHALAEYDSSNELLKKEIEETVARYCDRVANEIRFAN